MAQRVAKCTLPPAGPVQPPLAITETTYLPLLALVALGTVPSESLSGCSGGAVSVLAASPSTLGETNMTTEYAYLAAVSTTPAVCFGLLFGIDIIISSNSDCTKKLLDVDWIPKILSDLLTYFFFFCSYSIYLQPDILFRDQRCHDIGSESHYTDTLWLILAILFSLKLPKDIVHTPLLSANQAPIL